MLKVTLKEGESLAIGGNITVELKQIATSRRATILIDAPREIPVKRQKAEDPLRGTYTGPAADRMRQQISERKTDQTGQRMPGQESAGAAAYRLAGSGAAK